MKFLCNGFNLYGQLGRLDYVIECFKEVFTGYSIEDICVNHSFSVLKMLGNCKILYRKEETNINTCGKIVKICSNDERIVVLNEEGKIFKIDMEDIDKSHDITNLLNYNIHDENVINISCGSKLTVAYTDKGRLFNIPCELQFKNENIADIRCGREHCMLLDKDGNIYTFGRGSRGQLGHGILDDESEPKQVNALAGIKIVQIACGGWHSCAVSKHGDLYTWGWNGNGQLGLAQGGDVSVMASPHVVEFDDSEADVVKLACGNRHTIVLQDNNHLLGCGWNKYKQLNSLDKENFHSFTYLHDLSNETVVALVCGPWNSGVLCK